MGSRERIQRQKERVKESIIEAAMKVLHTEGLESVTMRKIADKLEYSPPIVYSYFESKEALLKKITEIGYQKLISGIKNLKLNISDVHQRLQSLCLGFEKFAMENHELYFLMSYQYLKNGINLEAVSYPHALAEIFKSEIRKLSPDSPSAVDHTYRSLISLIHGVICLGQGDSNFTAIDRQKTIYDHIIYLTSKNTIVSQGKQNGSSKV